eukprot:gene5981-5864_t
MPPAPYVGLHATGATHATQAYTLQGQYPQADKALRDLLASQERAHGRAHPATLSTLSGLACVKAYLGEVEAASILLEACPSTRRCLQRWPRYAPPRPQESLDGYGKAPDPGGRATAAMTSLAAVYRRLGRHEEALELSQRAAR